MFETLLPVVIGGVIGIVGSVGQASISSRNELKRQHIANREEAYLAFVDALLKIKVDDEDSEIDTNDFWPIFYAANAKLNLYGSRRIVKLSREFQWHLQECWENHWDKGTEAKKWELIEAIRKELRIDKIDN